MIRILHCVDALWAGGGARFVQTLIRYQQRRGDCQPALCVFSPRGIEPANLEGINDCRKLEFSGSMKDFPGILRFARGFRTLLREFRPDVVHSHMWPACRLAALAGTGLGVRHVWHIHDMWPWLWSQDRTARLYRLWTDLERRLARPRMIAVSRRVAEFTVAHLGWRPDSVIVIPNGVDLAAIRPGRDPGDGNGGPLVVGMTSLFLPGKGHEVLIQAVGEAVERDVEVEVRFAGYGSTEPHCRALVARLGLESRFDFRGFVNDIPAFLTELDVFVLPSTAREGMPMTVLEAMAAGVPVIAAPFEGVTELIGSDESGIVLDEVTPGALAAVLEDLAQDPERRLALAAAAREQAWTSFGFERVDQEIARIYQAALGG